MENIAKLDKRIKEDIKSFDRNKDEDGRSIINLTIYDDSEFLSQFSTDNEEVISEEVATYIENSAFPISPKDPIHIKISSDKIGGEKQDRYIKAINNYYFNKLCDLYRELKNNSIISLVLAVAGVLVLIGQFLLASVLDSLIVIEIINIMAWVFLWEACDQFFIERRKLKLKIFRYINIMNAKLSFYPLMNTGELRNNTTSIVSNKHKIK